MTNKWALGTVCVVLGGLQAWDSGVLRAEPMIQGLVAVALLLPVMTLLTTERYDLRAGAVAASFALLTTARVVSNVPLPTLHIVAFIPAVLIFFSKVVTDRIPRRTA